jgi:hypothetical protein
LNIWFNQNLILKMEFLVLKDPRITRFFRKTWTKIYYKFNRFSKKYIKWKCHTM